MLEIFLRPLNMIDFVSWIFKLLGTVTLLVSDNVFNCYLMMALLIAKQIISVWVSKGLSIVEHFVHARFITMVSNIPDLLEFKDKFWYFWKGIEQGFRFTDYFLYVRSNAGWACMGIVWVRMCISDLRTNKALHVLFYHLLISYIDRGSPIEIGARHELPSSSNNSQWKQATMFTGS